MHLHWIRAVTVLAIGVAGLSACVAGCGSDAGSASNAKPGDAGLQTDSSDGSIPEGGGGAAGDGAAGDSSTSQDGASGSGGSLPDAQPDAVQPSCGDGTCSSDETTATCPADCCKSSLSMGAARGSDAPVMTRTSYDYVPSVMHDGVYRMWWCGGVAGDHILYAEASSLDGPWHSHGSSTPGSWDDVFQPTGNAADFDGTHTCDPSVIRVAGKYYMYYGGYPSTADGDTTRIGVASSDDGFSWTRLNGGKPIVVPATDYHAAVNKYGAGQPSVTFVDGKFVLVFTDTTGLDINPGNGAGIFVLRSQDPTFQSGVEELSAAGFQAYSNTTYTQHKLIESFSVDWQYIDTIDAYAVASHTSGGKTRIHLFDKTLTSSLGEVEVAGSWTEGPGLVSRPDRHAMPSAECGKVPIDIMRSVGPGGPDTWDLAHDGADLLTGLGCECAPMARVLEGSLMESAGLPLTLVVGGTRLQFALAPPAGRLAKSHVAVSGEVFHLVPYGASMQAGAEVLGATGKPAAFHLDDGKLWPVSCAEVITDNGSSIKSVTPAEWDAIPVAHSLYCVR